MMQTFKRRAGAAIARSHSSAKPALASLSCVSHTWVKGDAGQSDNSATCLSTTSYRPTVFNEVTTATNSRYLASSARRSWHSGTDCYGVEDQYVLYLRDGLSKQEHLDQIDEIKEIIDGFVPKTDRINSSCEEEYGEVRQQPARTIGVDMVGNSSVSVRLAGFTRKFWPLLEELLSLDFVDDVLPNDRTVSSDDKPATGAEQNSVSRKHKSIAELDAELQAKMEGRAGDGGEAGVELEDGQPVAMKRSVKNNMFRYI